MIRTNDNNLDSEIHILFAKFIYLSVLDAFSRQRVTASVIDLL